MIIIDNKIKLDNNKGYIEELYRYNGKIFQQSYNSLRALFISNEQDSLIIFIDKTYNFITAFKKINKNIWECLFQGYPILYKKVLRADKIQVFLNQIKDVLETESLYFPLVYENFDMFDYFKIISKMKYFERLRTEVISNRFDKDIIWSRVLSKYGKNNATRQRKKFETNLIIKQICGKNPVYYRRIIKEVEFKSWKRTAHQDMSSRDNQIGYYSNLIASGEANIFVAYFKNIPIAFRIDSLSPNHVLYVIKWSFNEEYRKFSPGFYLLTVDLFKHYANIKLSFIDLFGSPDQLKDTIKNNNIKRFDFCLVCKPEIVKLLRKKASFDKKIFFNYLNNNSIKKAYLLHTN